MADQTLAALRKLTEAVMAEFFGNDTNLSKRLIAATNEAQLLLMAQPPNDDLANHPAPVKPVDLDALLSPAGPYETGPDAHMADGAQLVWDRHGVYPTWWAPVSGCDSLGILLARIRSRILPYLRPPANHFPGATEMVAPPAEGEAGGLVADLKVAAASYFNRGFVTDARRCRRAADLLQQQAAELAILRQQAAPVPVSERPWTNEAGWLDPDGECWWCPPDGPAYWSMANPAMVYGGWLLPAHAIPVPWENRHHA